MHEEIIGQVILAIKEDLRKLKKGPNQRFAVVALAEVQGRFPGGYFGEALKRLTEQGVIVHEQGGMNRFLTLTEEGYLWLLK
jgi:tetrahydromethanopterin S-methyltransferase subunit A